MLNVSSWSRTEAHKLVYKTSSVFKCCFYHFECQLDRQLRVKYSRTITFFAPTRFRTALATCQRAHKNAFSLIASTWNLHRSFVDCDVLWTLRRCNRDMIYSSKAKLIANDRFNCCAGCERAFNNKTFFAIYILRQAVNHGAGSW